ncbi:MAG: hypothetical protein KJ906_02135 [Nanoarchaeota archaeon]|nr:hypothetical protein [Nanoarchaeota archaeon]
MKKSEVSTEIKWKESDRNRELFSKLKKMNKKDIIKIIEMNYACNTCSELDKMNCQYQTLRKEMGMPVCYSMWEVYEKVKKIDVEMARKTGIIKNIVEDLENKFGKPVPVEEVTAIAENEGIEYEKVLEILVKLEREGSIFEPKNMFVQRD